MIEQNVSFLFLDGASIWQFSVMWRCCKSYPCSAGSGGEDQSEATVQQTARL